MQILTHACIIIIQAFTTETVYDGFCAVTNPVLSPFFVVNVYMFFEVVIIRQLSPCCEFIPFSLFPSCSCFLPFGLMKQRKRGIIVFCFHKTVKWECLKMQSLSWL